MYRGTPCRVTFVFLVPKYSATVLVKCMFPDRSFAAFSVASRMSHLALLFLANTFTAIFWLFMAYSIISLLMSFGLCVLMSVFNREILLAFTVSISVGTNNSSFFQ